MYRIVTLLLVIGLLSCGEMPKEEPTKNEESTTVETKGTKPEITLSSLSLKYLDGSDYSFDLGSKTATAYLFLAPDCPLCINYTLTIKQLRQKFSKDSIEIVGVFPGDYYTFEEIDSFVDGYQLEIPMILDPKLELTNNFKATVTPEAIVLNSNEEVIFQGAVDNWMYAIGRKRTIITEHYLNDNFHALTKSESLPWESNKAVGCLIEL